MDQELVAEKLRQRMTGETGGHRVHGPRGQARTDSGISLDARSVRTMREGAPAVMGSMVDITDRKQLEEALRACR